VPVSEYTPTVESVAAFIRARTKTVGGSELGTFSANGAPAGDTTRPTAAQATVEINNALGDISGIIGEDIDAKYRTLATRVAALRSALLIELTYWPEQIGTNRSAYIQLKELYDELWASLLDVMGLTPDDDGGIVPADAGFASYGGFPATAIGMEHPW
jgi:hypothetical protein